MVQVIKPLGDLLTTLPVGEPFDGRTAGASFELFYENDYLMPHRKAAWTLLAERLNEAAAFGERIRSKWSDDVGGKLAPITAALANLAATLGSPPTPEATIDDATRAALRQRADEFVAAEERGALVDAAYRLAMRALDGDTDTDAEFSDRAAQRLVNSVLRTLSGTSLGPGYPLAPAATSSTEFSDELWQLTQDATALRVQLGTDAPPELLEATAALQDLACELSPCNTSTSRPADLRRVQAAVPCAIQPAPNGPYLVTNAERLTDWLGHTIRTLPQMALCRCGQSTIKPFCDGTHASIGFSDTKDPHRVPDRRDTYDGVQVTILDNRGTCQHSGLCTDRLATVFHLDEEPFVAPSGGRMDDIIRAVRDCPSGALSYALDGIESRAHVDWDDCREPAIQVTKDGPYRVTGAIPLTDERNHDIARNTGASNEHYALCRCGHSQNKPFCSGMHWYIDFRDPIPDPHGTPTLFEWCGGLPALTRLCRCVYEKYIPDDSQLAPLFANMPVDHAQHVAEIFSAAFGDPSSDIAANPAGPLDGLILDDEQRARWIALFDQAADDVGLPTDAQFRAAFGGYLEWASRAAPDAPARWDWGPTGPPSWPIDQAQDDAKETVVQPRADEPISFDTHIKPLFRPKDRQSMQFVFDLWSYEDVAAHADAILERLRNGSMPCDGAWPAERVDVFRRWNDAGTPP
jgi:CDGSH-type Zn-finger protein/truncated hemoglobin YjbI